MKETGGHIVRMRDVKFEPSLFQNYLTGTALDELLCSYKGLPKGVNYMVIGDPGVGKFHLKTSASRNSRGQEYKADYKGCPLEGRTYNGRSIL